MKTILAATAVLFSATAGAYADSSILDVYEQPTVQHQNIDYTATAAIGVADETRNPRLGDGAPVYDPAGNADIAIGQGAPLVGARLGDGAPK